MLVSLGLLQNDIYFDKQLGRPYSKTLYENLRKCVQAIKKHKRELEKLESKIEGLLSMQDPDESKLEPLREKARRVRDSVYSRYEEIMGN